MKLMTGLLLCLVFSLSGKELKEDVNDWLAGRKIEILKTTVKDYWPDKTEKLEQRINLDKVINSKILIDTNEELAVLVKVPGLNIGKGREDGVVVTSFRYLHEGKKLTILAVFEYKKSLNKRTLSHVTFKTTNIASSKVRYAVLPSQP
ncbi:hypothetical protein PQO03_03000 [Lentisphaera profundi]|uniref:DUF4440 domain-containing protein n=1 Tax=Lentisphaera profundi TaxID=1658616 RepID=A0ABY7VVK9_9BACT|nr:hypothetical protein [Lentisphaera profundi]WDE96927.1 hypothetical protein PQO03_03000 [Lentisphaera profundi]